MEISIREWKREDLPDIQTAWLGYCRDLTRSDKRLKSGCEAEMAEWLLARFKQASSFGFVADERGAIRAFLIGRIGDWESVPPILEPRRIGMIDAVYVNEQFRRRGIARGLIQCATQTMKKLNVTAVETIYEASNEASTKTWQRAGFTRWMVHAYRML